MPTVFGRPAYVLAVVSLIAALHLTTAAQGPPARLKLSVWPPAEDGVLRCEPGQERQVGITAFDREGQETALFDYAPKASASPAGVIEVSVQPSGQIVYVRCVAVGRAEITVQVRGATQTGLAVQVATAETAGAPAAAPTAAAPATAAEVPASTPVTTTAAGETPPSGSAATLSGAGTAGKVPLWVSSSALSDSVITQTGGSGGGAPLGASVQQGRVNVNVAAPVNVAGAVQAEQFNLNSGSRVLGAPGNGNLLAGIGAGMVNQGSYNSFFGGSAGAKNTTGGQNSFFGEGAGPNNTTGRENSFFGATAGANNTTGGTNSFFGRSAGIHNTTGVGNSFFGVAAGANNTTGSNNTLIGARALVSAVTPDLSYATAIGAGARVSASNTIALGRPDGSDKVVIYGLGAGGLTQLCHNVSKQISLCSSSLRYKTGVRPFTPGLSVVKRLRPISFDWRADGVRDVGFGAEDVERIDPLFVTRNERGEIEGVKYDRLSVTLVNAVQEQQRQIEARDARISELERISAEQKRQASEQATQLAEQERRLRRLESLVQTLSGGKPTQ